MTSQELYDGGLRLPARIEPEELAESGRTLRGHAEWADLGRLARAGVRGRSDRVEGSFTAFREPGGAVVIEGRVEAEVGVTCQRCLGEVVLPVVGEFIVAVARSRREGIRLQDDYETIELERGERVDLAGLIEDEILLAVPLVPMHQDRSQCDAEALERLESWSGTAPKRANPFQVLDALRKG